MIMECREVRQLAESFVTEQLLVETTQAVVAHLERCAVCRAEVDGLRRLRAVTREAFLRSAELQARPALAGEVRDGLAAMTGSRTATFRWRRGVAAAAILVLVAGAGFALRRWSALDLAALLQAAAGDHQFCALTYKLSEPPITLAEAATRYDAINAALETVEPLPGALGGGTAPVLERHSCLYDGRRFAHIVVGYRGQAVSILVSDRGATGSLLGGGPPLGAGPVDMPVTGGFHVAAFRVSNRLVFVVSSLGQADVREVAGAMVAPVTAAAAGA